MLILRLLKTCHCKANREFVQTRGFGQINYSLAKFALHRKKRIPLCIWQHQHKPVILLFASLFCITICSRVQFTHWWSARCNSPERLDTFHKGTSLLCIARMLQHVPQICFIFMSGRYIAFHSDVTLPHFLKMHLILCLWLVSTNFWCRADGSFCVCRALSDYVQSLKYVNTECIIVTVDLEGLTSVENMGSGFFFVPLCSPRTGALRNLTESARNNQAGRSGGRQPGVSSPSTASERIPPESLFHSHFHSSHTTQQACFGLFRY